MIDHFADVCKVCGTVVAQCRCPSLNKTIRFALCLDHRYETAPEPLPPHLMRHADPADTYYARDLGDGRAVWVTRELFGSIKVGVGRIESGILDEVWNWNDQTGGALAAVTAVIRWDPATDPEPSGWYRHRPSNRRRPNGDPQQEYIEP